MKDDLKGGILATLLVAPVMIICCGGGAAFLVSIFAGSLGAFTGFGTLATLLIAVAAGLTFLIVRSFRRARRNSETGNPDEV